jgi:hypothetical protein
MSLDGSGGRDRIHGGFVSVGAQGKAKTGDLQLDAAEIPCRREVVYPDILISKNIAKILDSGCKEGGMGGRFKQKSTFSCTDISNRPAV